MHSVFITYAPDTPENRKTVEQVRSAFDPAAYAVTAKPAAGSLMPDLAGADLLVFGLQKAQGADAPAEYAELLRSLKGVNLAGRAAGVFSFGGEKASARLRKVLRDTSAAVAEEEPVFSDQKPTRQAEIEAWARQLSTSLQDLRRART
jgi:flavorubredoxin